MSLLLSVSDPDASSSLCKTVKSELFNYLKKSIPAIAAIPFNSPKIYDGMVLFQKLPPDLVTFGDIFDYILNKIMQGSCRICFFVTDYYLENSIKSLERKGRWSINVIRMTISRRNKVKPKQFQKFPRLPENKIDLVKFLINDWSSNIRHSGVLEGKEVYITVQDQAFCIPCSNNSISKVSVRALSSQQEEVGTKIFLCAQLAFQLGFERVNVVTTDTDVVELAVYFQWQLTGKIYMEYGTAPNLAYYDNSLHIFDAQLVQALPGIHALSGCDSTSCFIGKGRHVLKTCEM